MIYAFFETALGEEWTLKGNKHADNLSRHILVSGVGCQVSEFSTFDA